MVLNIVNLLTCSFVSADLMEEEQEAAAPLSENVENTVAMPSNEVLLGWHARLCERLRAKHINAKLKLEGPQKKPLESYYMPPKLSTLSAAKELEMAQEHWNKLMRRPVDDEGRMEAVAILAEPLCEQNRFAEAETILREVLPRMKEKLGNSHPTTLSTAAHLATTLVSAGIDNCRTASALQARLAEAEAMQREVLEGQTRVLGKDHPETRNTARNLSVTVDNRRRGEWVLLAASLVMCFFFIAFVIWLLSQPTSEPIKEEVLTPLPNADPRFDGRSSRSERFDQDEFEI